MRKQFKNDDFQFSFEATLGLAQRQSGDIGVILATAGRIKDGDADSWVEEWNASGDAAAAAAAECERAGDRNSARAFFLGAANYYSACLDLIAHSSQGERLMEIWRHHRECWDHAVDLFPVPGERLKIPYEDTTLPAYFFRAPDSKPGERRPLVVMNNGSDAPTSMTWAWGGAAAAERGYHWMTFDGPGQQAALFEQELYFRPDWEAVMTPVVDAMVARDDVDAEHLGLIGVSQAGYWVPRSLAFEHRFAAAVVDPGVVDVSTSWMGHLPGLMKKQLAEGKKEAFDRDLGLVAKLSKETRADLTFRGTPFGIKTDSFYDLFKETERYRLGDVVSLIDTPLLVTAPEDEQFWPGQAEELHDSLPGTKKLVKFKASDAAGVHCEPLSSVVRESAIFGWLDRYLAGDGKTARGADVTRSMTA